MIEPCGQRLLHQDGFDRWASECCKKQGMMRVIGRTDAHDVRCLFGKKQFGISVEGRDTPLPPAGFELFHLRIATGNQFRIRTGRIGSGVGICPAKPGIVGKLTADLAATDDRRSIHNPPHRTDFCWTVALILGSSGWLVNSSRISSSENTGLFG